MRRKEEKLSLNHRHMFMIKSDLLNNRHQFMTRSVMLVTGDIYD